MLQQFDTLSELTAAFSDEQTCIEHFRSIRWAHGAFCPYCGSTKIYNFSDKRTHKCGDCRQRFSIKVGTIFADTKLPLRQWFIAIWLITSHKKGIASAQLARDLGVTQKTAWFMLHRLRYAAKTKSFNMPLEGIVEVDETFVGGLAKNKHIGKRGKGRGTGGIGSGKTPVVGAVERGGEVVARSTSSVDSATLKNFVREHVSHQAQLLVTDQWVGYRGLDAEYVHAIINHSKGEYVRDDAHTNTIEGFWSLLKRQIYGIHHWVSPKHLDQYVGEATWRYNRREASEGGRVNSLLAASDGKRLTYKELIA